MSLFLPNPCLLGIFLTVSTYDGPQLVFHYPPKPNEYGYKLTPLAQNKTYLQTTGAVESSSSDSSSDDLDSDLSDDDDYEASSNGGSTNKNQSSRADSFNTHRSHDEDDNNEYLSGKALLDILDERDRKKKRKENKKKKLMKNIMLRNVDDSSSPVLDNGSSNHNSTLQKNKDTISHNTSVTKGKEQTLNKLFGFEIDLLSELITPPKKLCNTRFEVTIDDMSFLGLPIHVHDDGNWKLSHHRARTKTSKKHSRKSFSGSNDGDEQNELTDPEGTDDDEEKTHKDDKCPMNMFHLVFAMNPPIVEYNHRIDEMYHYIISRLTLILRYEQHKSNYVYKEAMKILALKEENRDLSVNDLWQAIIDQSSLAKVIYQTYESVSNSDIVNVNINGKIRSFQIPLKNEFTNLPPTTVSILKGSYLSSINPLFTSNEINQDNVNSRLLHFALILLDDPETIIRDIQAEKDSIIANFIKLIKPTESLSKLSTISGLDLNQIFSFCLHLVVWRRAILVPSLQTRNTYIVSPLAPLKNIHRDLESFKLQFQSLPSLPTFLSMLSQHSKPRPYAILLPSRDHRELYLEALLWLIKNGYALQLHTFIWLKVTNKIKVAVDEEIEMENFKKRERRQVNDSATNNETSTQPVPDNTTKKITDSEITDSTVLMTDNLVDAHELSTSPEKSASPKKKIVVVQEEDTILLDPERATALERRWISKIVEGKPPELITLFYRLLKYFNGKEALEMLLVRENISRQDMKRLLSSIDEYIVSVKHW